MRDEERDRDLLDYMVECIDRVQEYSGVDLTPMAEDAILRRLETLADAASRLSEDLTQHHTIWWAAGSSQFCSQIPEDPPRQGDDRLHHSTGRTMAQDPGCDSITPQRGDQTRLDLPG